MAVKAKIDYPAVDTVRVEVAHPDGTPRVIVRTNRFQAVVDAARAINGANVFTTDEPIAPSGDDKYIKTLRKAVAYNERVNKILADDPTEPATDKQLADAQELLEAPSVEAYAMAQFDKLAEEPGE